MPGGMAPIVTPVEVVVPRHTIVLCTEHGALRV